MTVKRRKRISLPETSNVKVIAGDIGESSVAVKGQFLLFSFQWMISSATIYGRQEDIGDAGDRTPCLSHAKRALYHLSYIP
ncbi:hypothetical protein GQ457_04G011690 [Hibiscus cannabinus]